MNVGELGIRWGKFLLLNSFKMKTQRNISRCDLRGIFGRGGNSVLLSSLLNKSFRKVIKMKTVVEVVMMRLLKGRKIISYDFEVNAD